MKFHMYLSGSSARVNDGAPCDKCIWHAIIIPFTPINKSLKN